MTLVNNGSFFIDYFLVIPAGATSTFASSSNPPPLTNSPTTVASADSSSTTAGAGAESHSSRVSLGPAVGGTLGGLALLIFSIFAIFLCCKRRKDKNKMRG